MKTKPKTKNQKPIIQLFFIVLLYIECPIPINHCVAESTMKEAKL